MSAEQKSGFDGHLIGPLTHLSSEFYVVTLNYLSSDRKETTLLGEINMTRRREKYTELSL